MTNGEQPWGNWNQVRGQFDATIDLLLQAGHYVQIGQLLNGIATLINAVHSIVGTKSSSTGDYVYTNIYWWMYHIETGEGGEPLTSAQQIIDAWQNATDEELNTTWWLITEMQMAAWTAPPH